jgi:hypothetical protein
MAWYMLTKQILTADNSSTAPGVFQQFRLGTAESPALLRGLSCGIVLYNDPAFTSLTMELWSDRTNAPGKLIATSSTSYAKAVLLTTNNHGVRFLGFTFGRIPLRPGSYYHAAIRLSGYTGTDSSYVGWRVSYPDLEYSTGITQEKTKAGIYPLQLSVLTAEQG